MRVCPRCEKSRRVVLTMERDKKTKKLWAVQKCIVCRFNFDLEEFADGTDGRKKMGFFKRRSRTTTD